MYKLYSFLSDECEESFCIYIIYTWNENFSKQYYKVLCTTFEFKQRGVDGIKLYLILNETRNIVN